MVKYQSNPDIPNIDALNSDTYTLRIRYKYTQKQFLGVANEGIDILYMGINFQVNLIPEPSSSSVSFQAPLKQSGVELFLTRPTITANKAPTIMSMST